MVIQNKYVCPKCRGNSFKKTSTLWICSNCNHHFTCENGMPKLYLENEVGEEDKSLRDYFYNGLLGKFYQFLMPFMTLPARPLKGSKKDWFIYFLVLFGLINLTYLNINIFIGNRRFDSFEDIIFNIFIMLLFLLLVRFFLKNKHFFYLMGLAIPVKISLDKDKFQPDHGFLNIHKKIIDGLLEKNMGTLQILDISTGTGNSLYRHGWMKLDAEYTGLDLSSTMLTQCQSFMVDHDVAVDLVIGDATNLPFVDAYFDVVLNYGAINGFSDIEKALKEMARVVKKDGFVLFLDEQLYLQASKIEKLFFKKVLSSHNKIHHCPVEYLPKNAQNIRVYQVYEFYYICVFSVK